MPKSETCWKCITGLFGAAKNFGQFRKLEIREAFEKLWSKKCSSVSNDIPRNYNLDNIFCSYKIFTPPSEEWWIILSWRFLTNERKIYDCHNCCDLPKRERIKKGLNCCCNKLLRKSLLEWFGRRLTIWRWQVKWKTTKKIKDIARLFNPTN